jgi:phosphinothricin acetyltransferase
VGAGAALIRDAVEGDLEQILAIYNDAVLTTTATYDYEPRSTEAQRAWFAAKQTAGYPVLVADQAGTIVGFASYGPFRAWAGYRHTIEHSVYVAADCRRQGLGRALLEPLISRARDAGFHIMIGGIDADNAASIRLHEALGFERTAHMREVGRKFDRWLDLVFMQHWLAGKGASPRA